MSLVGVVVAAACLSGPVAAGEADLEVGRQWYTVCGSCHGEYGEGIDSLQSPRLQGMTATYLVRQLENFRSGRRGSDAADELGQQMRSMAELLPDSQAVAAVAAYIATLRGGGGRQTAIVGDLNKGRLDYSTCASCHGARGEGIEALKSPPLAGQDPAYLLRQLRDFAQGRRGRDSSDVTGQQMVGIAAALGRERSFEDVVSYIASLPAPTVVK